MTDGLVASGDDALLRTLFELLVTDENPELVSDGRFDVRDETVRVMVRERVEEGLMEQSPAASAEDVHGEGHAVGIEASGAEVGEKAVVDVSARG